MTGAIVKFSPFSESATRLPHSSAPVWVLSASRNPSGVARTTRPSLRATPRLRSHRTSPRGLHVCRHFTRQLAASSAIVLLDVVRYIVPSCTQGASLEVVALPDLEDAGRREPRDVRGVDRLRGEKRVPP